LDVGAGPAEAAGFALEVEVFAGVVGVDCEEGCLVAVGAGGAGGAGEVFADDGGGGVAAGVGGGEAGFAGVEGDVGCVSAVGKVILSTIHMLVGVDCSVCSPISSVSGFDSCIYSVIRLPESLLCYR